MSLCNLLPQWTLPESASRISLPTASIVYIEVRLFSPNVFFILHLNRKILEVLLQPPKVTLYHSLWRFLGFGTILSLELHSNSWQNLPHSSGNYVIWTRDVRTSGLYCFRNVQEYWTWFLLFQLQHKAWARDVFEFVSDRHALLQGV